MKHKKPQLKPTLKFSTEKINAFQSILEDLIANGHEVFLTNGQTRIWLYLPEGRGINLTLDIDGRWGTE